MDVPPAQVGQVAAILALRKENDKIKHPDIETETSQPIPSSPREAPALHNLLVWGAIALSSFCVFLDEGVIATAIPIITDRFNSLGDIGVCSDYPFETI